MTASAKLHIENIKIDIDRKNGIYVLTMNIDPSSNHIMRRGGGGGGGGGSGNNNDDRNRNDYYERFNLNQYYNAVEDEQIYMDEYTTLLHRYNDFIVNGNAMFSRMEQTLRENLSRTLVRQSFYYHQHNDYLRSRRPPTADPPVITAPVPAPVPPVAASPINSAPSPSSTQQRISDVFPRLLSRYLNNEMEREMRRPNNDNNIFSMLYTTIPLAARTNNANAVSAPTNEQINRATMNTTFGHIITPVNATCPISRDEFNDDSEITMIRGCNHIFNRASLREWFVNHSTCPMCRSDIRHFTPTSVTNAPEQSRSSSQQRTHPSNPANLSIDSIDNNHMTFSYDLPINYNDEQIYQDIVNTVNNMTNRVNRNRDNPDDNDDDIMDVD